MHSIKLLLMHPVEKIFYIILILFKDHLFKAYSNLNLTNWSNSYKPTHEELAAGCDKD